MGDDPRALLTNLELEVMQCIWATPGEPVTVREVVQRLNASRSKPLAYNTVQTMLTILRDKGVVNAEPGPGRAHTYIAVRSREEVRTSMVGDLVSRLFDGNVRPLLVHLLGREDLSPEELRDLRGMIDAELDDREPGS